MTVNKVKQYVKALILTEEDFIQTIEDTLLVDGISIRMVASKSGNMEEKLFIPVLPERFKSDAELHNHFDKEVVYIEDEVDGEIGISMNLIDSKNILEKVYSTSLTGEYTSRDFDGFTGSYDAFFFTMA
ncbi:hypothetical protein P4T70_25545 [Bacillus mobilis]|uniref:hypothetical protein n=1 Tax=Bacillus mobilis TaxID=2026190 RepID=UPI002E2340F4|nr:hypothetical protein [Bacillus mobilis]